MLIGNIELQYHTQEKYMLEKNYTMEIKKQKQKETNIDHFNLSQVYRKFNFKIA